MKRLIGAALASTLALSLLGATAASAQPMHGSFAPVDYRDHSWRHHGDGDGAAVAAGIGFLALTAILASQANRDRDDWDDRDRDWRDRDYGYRDYDRGYGYAAPRYAAPYGGYRGW